MLDSLTFVTGNPGKARQLARYLTLPVHHETIDLVEIQSLDLVEIVEYKAREAYKHIHSPVLVEDASLQFLALGKLPGPFIKWFLTELGTSGLCKLLDGTSDRSAGHHKTWGEMDETEARETSMRILALNQLETYLATA